MPAKAKPGKVSLRKEIISKITLLVVSAFGLIAALAWNSAIQALVTKFLGTASQLGGLFINVSEKTPILQMGDKIGS